MQILVVEDEAIIALYIGMTLQEAGHEVVGVASSLDDAVKLLDQKIPDIALIDINLGKDEE
ncbi:response regulator (plasmid) [Skermanella mucosa]|uniref:response regulator n=1 Tax=Skermanella mucosa TaxID=1789672 RepID=UPI001E39DA3D|nr:response regulator [Skermanella mucosa]UEM24264.1 response regulator [Skermanella mucosa]